MTLADFKAQFARVPEFVHLNNAGLAPITLAAREAVSHWSSRFHLEGMHCNDDYMAAAEIARGQLARLAGCDPGQVAFFQSTAGAVSQVAFGMELRAEDEVLLWAQEYPSILYPWKAACDRVGASLKLVLDEPDLSTPAEKLLAAVGPRTRVIALSWVQFQTGAVSDLAAIAAFARARGIWTVVDIIQGFGLLPFNFADLGIDFACGGSHKWLASPVGVGYLILRVEHLKKLRPLTIGASTYGTCDDASDLACRPKVDALRFESGSKQVLEITALGASAEVIRKTGCEVLARETARLALKLGDGIRDLGWSPHTPRGASPGFVNFGCLDAPKIAATLRAAGISYALRGPGVRLSPHAFNTDEDIERVLSALTKFRVPDKLNP